MQRSHMLRFLTLSLFLGISFVIAKAAMAQEELILTLSVESDNVYTTESTEVFATLKTSAGEPVVGQEITFTTDLGTLNPDRAVTDDYGDVQVTFNAPNESGVSQITATANGVSQTIEVTVTSTGQWIISVILCLLGLLGGGGATAFYLRRAKLAKQKD